MAAFGAKLTIIKSAGGLITKTVIQDMIGRSASGQPRTAHVLDRPTQQCGHNPRLLPDGPGNLGSDGRQCDAFVHSIGTSASLQGVAMVLSAQQTRGADCRCGACRIS